MLVVGGGVSAWMIRSQVSIDEAWKFLLALGAGTGAVFMLRWYWWRINAWSELSAMMASLVYFASLQGRFTEPEVTILVVALATIVTWLVVTTAHGSRTKGNVDRFLSSGTAGRPRMATDRSTGTRCIHRSAAGMATVGRSVRLRHRIFDLTRCGSVALWKLWEGRAPLGSGGRCCLGRRANSCLAV